MRVGNAMMHGMFNLCVRVYSFVRLPPCTACGRAVLLACKCMMLVKLTESHTMCKSMNSMSS